MNVRTGISDSSKIRLAPKVSEVKFSISWGVPVKDLNIRLWKLEGYKVNADTRVVTTSCNRILKLDN